MAVVVKGAKCLLLFCNKLSKTGATRAGYRKYGVLRLEARYTTNQVELVSSWYRKQSNLRSNNGLICKYRQIIAVRNDYRQSNRNGSILITTPIRSMLATN